MTNTGSHKVVVLGGGYAGLTAAARVGESQPDALVTLIDAKPQFVERIRLHEVASGSPARHLPYDEFMAARNGRFVQAWVREIDPKDQVLRIDREDETADTIEYDTLVYAPGSTTDRNAVPGADEFAAFLDTTAGSEALAARLGEAAQSGGTLLIAGGGLTAIEAACEFGERMPNLNIVMAPGRQFGPGREPGDLSQAGFDHVVTTLAHLGVKINAGARITALRANEAEMDDGQKIPFDTCLWAAGFLVPDLAAKAGLQVTESGQVVTDESLVSVSHPNILAVGDAAYVVTDTAGPCRMSCAAGRPMGELAARTIANVIKGTPLDSFDFSYSFRCISLGREDGLIQFVDARDRPVEQVWTGERGAVWKEYICRRTLAGIGFDADLGPPPDTPPPVG